MTPLKALVAALATANIETVEQIFAAAGNELLSRELASETKTTPRTVDGLYTNGDCYAIVENGEVVRSCHGVTNETLRSWIDSGAATYNTLPTLKDGVYFNARGKKVHGFDQFAEVENGVAVRYTHNGQTNLLPPGRQQGFTDLLSAQVSKGDAVYRGVSVATGAYAE